MYLTAQLRRTFIFVCCISVLTAGIMIYIKWQNVLSEASTELHYANTLASISSQTLLSQKESLLRIMGERLLELDSLKKSEQAQHLIDELLSSNPELAGFGLADTSGQFILTSFNIDSSKLPNLLHQKESAKTFRQALNTDGLVLGHTYFMKALNQWLIPIRLRLADDNGKVYAVMTSGLKIDNVNSPWNKHSLPGEIDLSIIREDFYRLYSSHVSPEEFSAAYQKPFTASQIELFSKELLKQTGETIERLKTKGKIVEMFYIDALGRKTMGVFSFNEVYRFHLITIKPLSYMLAEMVTPIIWILTFIVIFNVSLYILFKVNIRLQKRTEDELKFQAEHDQLTNLPNRYYLKRVFSRWSEKHKNYAILFVDLNNFKTANDLYGHTVGDQILIEVAERIKTAFPNGLHVRHGGDEFTILLDRQDSDEALEKCKQFLYTLKYPVRVNDMVFSIGASIGIAHYPKDGTKLGELLRKADITMYDAKKQASNISLFTSSLEEVSKRRSSIEEQLEHAIRLNELSLVYQPQIDAETHRVVGVEALLRWHNKNLGEVPPDEFIPIAETTGLIHSIGLFVLTTAIREVQLICKQLTKKAGAKKIPVLRLSVNISVQQLLNKDFYSSIISLIDQHNSCYMTLMFEVTETLLIEDVELAKSVLVQLQQHNIEVSLDDFGTGYSSLSVLSQLPINELKIDKSFVKDILVDQQDSTLIQNIISIGKSMGIQVLAEGVEQMQQIKILEQSGCDLYQGYYSSRPLSREDLQIYLQNDFFNTSDNRR